jgi:Mce-associated membrane protein
VTAHAEFTIEGDIEVDEPVEGHDVDELVEDEDESPTEPVGRVINWRRVLVFGALPGLALLLAIGLGLLKWLAFYPRDCQTARVQSVQAAKDSTVAMLSYKPDTVERTLPAAESLMTGSFRDSYAKLIHDVVIPGAQQQRISTVAEIPAAAPVVARPDHAVVLLYVNQSATVGSEAPTNTASCVRVTLENIKGHWLVSGFDPI